MRRSPCLRLPSTRSRPRRPSRSPHASATTESRSWCGPIRSARTSTRCADSATTTACRFWPCTRPACSSPSASGPPTPGSSSSAPAPPPRARRERRGGPPPFRWQRQYARDFVSGIWRMADETDVRFAVENTYPWRYRDREMQAYAPDSGRDEGGLPSLHDRSQPRRHLPHRHPRHARPHERPPRPRPPRRRQGLRQGRTPRPRPRRPAPAPRCWSTSRTPASTATSSSRSTPVARCPAPNVRPISPRRWPSPACTWRRERTGPAGPAAKAHRR